MRKKITCIGHVKRRRTISGRKAIVRRYNAGEAAKAAKDRWRKANAKWTWAIYVTSSVKLRAKRRGREYNLSKEYVFGLITDERPVFKVPLNYNYAEKKEGINTPSIDRIDPSKGYVEGNIIIISQRANMIKSNASWQELKTIAEWLRSLYGDTEIHG